MITVVLLYLTLSSVASLMVYAACIAAAHADQLLYRTHKFYGTPFYRARQKMICKSEPGHTNRLVRTKTISTTFFDVAGPSDWQ